MTETKSKSYRLPVPLLDRIEKLAKDGDRTQTEVIIDLLYYGLNALDSGENVMQVASIARQQDSNNTTISPSSIEGLEEFINNVIEKRIAVLQDELQGKIAA